MFEKIIFKCLGVGCLALSFSACTPTLVEHAVNTEVPVGYNDSQDTSNIAEMKWKEYFTDPYLTALIDTALSNNQELNIMLQEIEISRNEVQARKGEYLPSVGIGAEVQVDKVGRYTRNGALEANNEIRPGEEFPEPFSDYMIGAFANWEVDIWRKLRTAKKSAYKRYLSSVDGRNFMVTNLVAEIANSYYELLALDNQLAIVKQNIEIQRNALEIVKLQKQSARVTELAVRRFEAQVLNTMSLQYDFQQLIVETENRINFLIGRFPQPIARDYDVFSELATDSVQFGVPSQLLQNRPDIRQAELELQASKLDIKVAKANFYPSLGITAGIGYQAFNPKFLLNTPESMLYYLGGDLMAPLVNRKAIKAAYFNANAKQVQAAYDYQRTVLNAYIEVVNQLSNIQNLQKSYDLTARQVEALTQSVDISNTLFKSARADYMEVLLTQRDALESKFDLIETKMKQMNAKVNIYRALGGGWN
ncbi:TolC family protein [Marinoscillum sp. MHG1-6]|uniref:TolC family protein n=1 Tax=Marinoscillum sp. MHG1-6 TaxID=2959627 RepID=UPI002158250A|nr:efflux transporter outer membrane subunit [Marinoscillum sp. MHG1-6]